MAEILLFHHAQGRTGGFLEFADDLRSFGHTVRTPDLYDGRTFDRIEEGVAHAERIGFDHVVARSVEEAGRLPETLVYAGFSLGALSAQALTQTQTQTQTQTRPVPALSERLAVLYPGSGHLFADPSLSDYDAHAAALLKERTCPFCAALAAGGDCGVCWSRPALTEPAPSASLPRSARARPWSRAPD